MKCFRHSSHSAFVETAAPSAKIVPLSVFPSPSKTLMNVVFPAPLSPTSAIFSPFFTRKQISCRTFFSPYPKSTCSIEISEIVLLSAAMDSWFLSFDTSPFCSQKSKNPSMYPAYSPALPAICSNSTDSAYRMMCVPFKSAAKSSSPIVFFQKKQYPRYAIIKQSINRKSLPISRPNAIGKIRRFHCFVCSAFCEKLS